MNRYEEINSNPEEYKEFCKTIKKEAIFQGITAPIGLAHLLTTNTPSNLFNLEKIVSNSYSKFFGISLMIGGTLNWFYLHETNKKVFHWDGIDDSGQYKYTRNPMYLSLEIVSIGSLLYNPTLPNMIVATLWYLCLKNIINAEEKKLEMLYGEKYTSYKKKTPRWISKILR